MPPQNITPQLLDKYLRNECTEQEKALVEAWYASLDGKPDFLGALPEHEQQQLQDETFLAIREQLEAGPEPLVRPLWKRWATWLAASVVLVLGVFGLYRYAARPDGLARSEAVGEARPHPTEQVQFVNREARLVKHRLPDGSQVWMHTGASLAYPKAFTASERLVTFSGEGFFDVVRDTTRPFLIRSGEMKIRVLGTSFNVNAPATRAAFRIAVVTGRVQVSAPDQHRREQQVILKPREQAVFEPESRRLTASVIPLQARKEMYEPVSIAFEDSPIRQVTRQLEKRFNVHIRLSNPGMASCRVSGDFEKQPLPMILEMLCISLEATYTLSGNEITLNGLPCE